MPDQAVRIDAVAVHGHIRSTLPALIVANEGQYGQHARGIIGGKQTKATIILHADTGSIALLKSGESSNDGCLSTCSVEDILLVEYMSV
jgi:hypothetical protein